jgi:hypothetical protein
VELGHTWGFGIILRPRGNLEHKRTRVSPYSSSATCLGQCFPRFLTTVRLPPSESKMLHILHGISTLPRPAEHPLENFCSSVFEDTRNHRGVDAQVTRIDHFKEKVNWSLCVYRALMTDDRIIEQSFTRIFDRIRKV